MYRIFTENIPRYRKAVQARIAASFSGFTMFEGVGSWEGTTEQSLCIEICDPNESAIRPTIDRIAHDIGWINGKQQAVLVQHIPNNSWLVRN